MPLPRNTHTSIPIDFIYEHAPYLTADAIRLFLIIAENIDGTKPLIEYKYSNSFPSSMGLPSATPFNEVFRMLESRDLIKPCLGVHQQYWVIKYKGKKGE